VANLIREKFTFKIGEDKIEVWSDAYNHEYITYDGVWQARYLHQTYDVECSVEGIFNLFRAEYLISKGFASEYEGDGFSEAGELNYICRYFRTFVSRNVDNVDNSTDTDL
jgi:hypothetical protein